MLITSNPHSRCNALLMLIVLLALYNQLHELTLLSATVFYA